MAYFSILIPVYNQVGLMDRCIASIREQTFDDFEVILVNDGSTDDSISMLNGFAKEDPRFRVVSHEKNSSLLAARFTGMKAVEGSHVLFVDSDDYIEKTMLEELKDAFEEHQVDLIRFGYRMEPDGVDWLPPACEDPLAGVLDGKFPPAIWKNAYKAEVVKAAAEKGESFYCNMGEDSYMASILFSNVSSSMVLPRVFYHYITGTGMSGVGSKNSLAKIKKAYDSMYASGSHLIAYIDQYRPDYSEKARKAAQTMYKYLLVQNVVEEEDPENIVRFINFFDMEETAEIFRFACNHLLKFKLENKGKAITYDEFNALMKM